MMATLTVLRVIIVIGTLRLMSALGSSRIVLVIMAVLMLFPLINLIALIMENIRAAKLLRRAGIAVRFLGARDDDVVRCLAANVCRQCGYDLMLNESARCPECGTHLAGEATKELAIRRAYQRIVGPPG